MNHLSSSKTAVLIPCFNEHLTIVKVINDFKNQLPDAEIFVFDNNSTDGSLELAKNAGATVIKEKRQGKGFVVSTMLHEVIADYYVMVDADDTYPAERVHDLLAPVINEEADMVVGQRLTGYAEGAFRPLHYGGNKLICGMINLIFSSKLKDPMSGFRAFNRSVAINLPIVATGFDVETEMTLQLLYRHFKIQEMEIAYRERPKGSFSKLDTWRDGIRVLYKIFSMVQSYKPLTFFGGVGLILLIIGLIIGGSASSNYMVNQLLPSLSQAILSVGFVLAGVLSIMIGLILHNMNFRLLEISSVESRMFHFIDRIKKEE